MGFFDKLKNGLGKTKTSFNDKMNNIFTSFKKVDEELVVYVGNIKKFMALPGYSEDKYAVRVTEVIREESE